MAILVLSFFVAGCGEPVAPTSLKLLDEFSGGLAWPENARFHRTNDVVLIGCNLLWLFKHP
ncbi:MAG: hypothetical protein O2856_03785 [Planctomycetota bacterium]|nr:hypothetical protein [Planctomycetota bacterium]